MPNQHPLTTEINQLISRNLASQRPETRLQGTILSTDGNFRPIDNIQDLTDMHKGGNTAISTAAGSA